MTKKMEKNKKKRKKALYQMTHAERQKEYDKMAKIKIEDCK